MEAVHDRRVRAEGLTEGGHLCNGEAISRKPRAHVGVCETGSRLHLRYVCVRFGERRARCAVTLYEGSTEETVSVASGEGRSNAKRHRRRKHQRAHADFTGVCIKWSGRKSEGEQMRDTTRQCGSGSEARADVIDEVEAREEGVGVAGDDAVLGPDDESMAGTHGVCGRLHQSDTEVEGRRGDSMCVYAAVVACTHRRLARTLHGAYGQPPVQGRPQAVARTRAFVDIPPCLSRTIRS